ncbi:MAG: chromosome segregation protein SMC, partial [Pseudomonadota bacterium]
MRLKSIKLAGFKSFVDPTPIPFATDLTAIVGPNGCGKSNVIDAVRWVMGESSAKYLRGESMADVIFNGSSARKPVAQASVELVFDNSDHKLGGEYANFAEISIRRQVTRDGQSNYFLNGARCRRRDITDIFLGTGLGPRSYAIIEQGMISRLIEAKPDELRLFIEEAAGISKYKERRRETETRMQRTRENLDRVNDLREELDRQLQRLQRQSKTAEMYTEKKEQLRTAEMQLAALRWQRLQQNSESQQQDIRQNESVLEGIYAQRIQAEKQIVLAQEEQQIANDAFQEIHEQHYSVGTEIARLEQRIQEVQRRRTKLEQDRVEIDNALQRTAQQKAEDQLRVSDLEAKITEHNPQFLVEHKRLNELAERRDVTRDIHEQKQEEWELYISQSAGATQTAQVQQSRIQQLEIGLKRLEDRGQRLSQEETIINQSTAANDLAIGETLIERLTTERELLSEQRETVQEQFEALQIALTALIDEQNQRRLQQQEIRGRLASLEALQQAALGDDNDVEQTWLQSAPSHPKRLAEELEAEEAWQDIIERVLGERLKGFVVSDLKSWYSVLEQATFNVECLTPLNALEPKRLSYPTLAEQVRSNVAKPLLQSIYIAESLEHALKIQPQLQTTESVVTTDGMWLGLNWARLLRRDHPEAGVIKRQQLLQRDRAANETNQAALAQLETAIAEQKDQLSKSDEQRRQIQKNWEMISSQYESARSEYRANQVRLEQIRIRREQLQTETTEVNQLAQQERQALILARRDLEEALEQMSHHENHRELLQEERLSTRQQLDQAEQDWREVERLVYAMERDLGESRALLDSAQHNLNRIAEQQNQLEIRRKTVDESFAELAETSAWEEELEQRLQQQMEVEEQLTAARQQLESVSAALRQYEQQRQSAEHQAERQRSTLEQWRLQLQTIEVQRQQLEEQANESQWNFVTVLQALTELQNDLEEQTSENKVSESNWQSRVQTLTQEIDRLGPVNLAAIEEFKTESERRNYLEAQHADLIEALTTLEEAIMRIDAETRDRFKETFEKVNQGLQTLFPQVFGGGSAWLELIGDDLLNTGVSIMARPPGKKNSTIHLLSGGEKALTAIALVFAIFQLHPAPFCMLDEVDAPLDDANVLRYSRLVKQMSQQVQFIYITHNKLAMEVAHQLMGVTMHEPGVS